MAGPRLLGYVDSNRFRIVKVNPGVGGQHFHGHDNAPARAQETAMRRITSLNISGVGQERPHFPQTVRCMAKFLYLIYCRTGTVHSARVCTDSVLCPGGYQRSHIR